MSATGPTPAGSARRLDTDLALRVRGVEVARYVHAPELDPYLSPRPYLHPVRTLLGTVVTAAVPDDHHWHLGVSVALQDVNKVNFWGGRTYVRGRGYVALDDHGTVQHHAWSEVNDSGFRESLQWIGPDGAVLLSESRTVRVDAVAADVPCWSLDMSFALRNSTSQPVSLGSPATNGRAGAGYGGFFWRAPESAGPIDVFTDAADGEDSVHGTTAPWLALTGDAGDAASPYTLVFLLAASEPSHLDPWFVRIGAYPGVCAALAFSTEVVLAADSQLSRLQRVLVVDGRLSRVGVTSLLHSLTRSCDVDNPG